jgi:hypothetical protein
MWHLTLGKMNWFPKRPSEQNRLGMRFLSFIASALAISFYGRFAKDYMSNGRHLYWGYFYDWEIVSLEAASFLAFIMLGWSSVVLFRERRFRDTRYGIAGIILALGTLAVWLFPTRLR